MVGEQGGAQKWRLQIKEDDKFFSRLLSKESSTANPSLRVYYGGVSGAVPFTWESQPGTPKHPSTHSDLPPLTPPPSYYSNSRQNMPGAKKKLPRSIGLLHSIFTRLNKKSKPPEVLSTSSSSCSSSMSGSLTAPNFLLRRRRQCCSSRSSSDSRGEEYEEEEAAEAEAAAEGVSPTLTLCFRMGGSGSGELRRRSSVVSMKKAFLSMVGHESGQGTA